MAVSAHLTHLQSEGNRLEVRLTTCDGPVTVPLELSTHQAHALRHHNACIAAARHAPDVAAPTDLLVSLLQRHGLTPHALEITLDRGIRLRYGDRGEHVAALNVVDGVALLLRGELPVLLDLPEADDRWDAALAELTD